MRNEKNQLIVVSIALVTFVALVIFFPFGKKIPEGLPNNYFDRIDIVESSHINLYIYSDQIDLNDDMEYYIIDDMETFTPLTSTRSTFIIIDMEKYIQNYEDISYVQNLYENSCYPLIIAYNQQSRSTYFSDFVDSRTSDSDLFFLVNDDSCNLSFQTFSFESEFPGLLYLNYGIIDSIARIIEESNAVE